eukprot:7810302-Pyramimonas_sp.AAC.1
MPSSGLALALVEAPALVPAVAPALVLAPMLGAALRQRTGRNVELVELVAAGCRSVEVVVAG